MEILEMIENITIASLDTKGYKFHCANVPNKCQECALKLVSYVTQDIEEAYQHSKRNNVAMWLVKD